MRASAFSLSFFLLTGLFAGLLRAQAPDAGFPVTEPLVVSKCGTCHPSDAQGNMERVSTARATPEGWQAVVKKMIQFNNAALSPEEARAVLRYLSTANGLAPEEARPVLYEAERRARTETEATPELRKACARCHTLGRSLSWRRSGAEWKTFVDSHAARFQVKAADAAAAVEFLTKAAPLHTAAWDGWKTKPGMAGLTGRWLATASMPGRGQFFGEMQVERTGEEELTTRVTLTSVKDGSKIARTGKSTVYAGTAWRGRSQGAQQGTGRPGGLPDDPLSEAREAMWISADQSEGEGRWFWGEYQEFGIDVKLRRAASGKSVLLLADRFALKAGTTGNRVRLIGENLPAPVTAEQVQLGAGVMVKSVVSASAGEVVVLADVAADAAPGKRDLRVGDAVLPGALAVYDRMDYLMVTPESTTATFGDREHGRGYQAFEAVGYQRGPDGKLHTADDLWLGPVEVTWKLQVFHKTDGGETDFVATLSEAGLLTPAAKNPDANFDTWVVATAKNEKTATGAALTGKAFVVVTIPTYAFAGRQWVRDLDRWVDDGPARTGPRVQ